MKRNTRHTKSLQTRHRNRLRPSGALCNISCVLFWIGEYWVSSDPSSCRIGIPTEPDITREASVDAAAFLGMKIHCNISGNERYALEPWNTSRSPHHVLALQPQRAGVKVWLQNKHGLSDFAGGLQKLLIPWARIRPLP